MHHVSTLLVLLSLLLSVVPRASSKVIASFVKEEEENTDQVENEDELVKAWNRDHCQIKGCRPITTALWNRMKRYKKLGDELSQRNAVLDPLFHPNNNLGHADTPTNHQLNAKYLGVMVDAGRHYFSIEWLHNLLDLMSVLQFNLLHLRLTDDEAFRVRLDSIPELANPSDHVYTSAELKDLVEYASKRGIHIMPEISLPNHAGGWAGNIPGMIVPCTERICDEPLGLPLNLHNPNVTRIVQTVLREIVQIFDSSPFLHLGGNDMRWSVRCLEEIEYLSFPSHYQTFETNLEHFLRIELQSKQQVVRWESSPPSTTPIIIMQADNSQPVNPLLDAIDRVKRGEEISHYTYRIKGEFRKLNKRASEKKQRFCSDHRFGSRQDNSNGTDVYQSTRAMIDAKQPLAVIADTRALGMYEWFDRNVIGKLIAAAMAARSEPNMEVFDEAAYDKWCRNVLGRQEVCVLRGAPLISNWMSRFITSDMQNLSDKRICNRLTFGKRQQVRQLKRNRKQVSEIAEQAMSNFWNRLGETPRFTTANIPATEYSTHYEPLKEHVGTRAVERTGIVLDLVRIPHTDDNMSRIISTLDLMNALGMNTLQLRIMSDHGFVVELNEHRGLLWGRSIESGEPYFSQEDIQRIVTRAEILGIQVIPELATATRGAGGWYAAGLQAHCPNHMCTGGFAGADANNNNLFSVIVSVLYELMDQFHNPPYIHLGYDDRQGVKACFEEAFNFVDLDEFERRLKKTLNFHRFDESRLIRWENPDGGAAHHYRAGTVTHHYFTGASEGKDDGTEIFTSVDLTDTQVDAWGVYQQTRKLASVKPTATLATVDWIHESFWNEFQITQRLVALAMGLTSSSTMSKSAFDDELKKALFKLNLEGDGRVANTAMEMIADDTESSNDQACNARTVLVEGKYTPKEGVLV